MITAPKNPIFDVLKAKKDPNLATALPTIGQSPVDQAEIAKRFESPEQKFQREFIETQQTPTDVVAQGFLKGAVPTVPTFDAQEFSRDQASLGMPENTALSQALQKRSQKYLDTSISALKRDAELAAFERRAKGLSTASEVLAKQRALRDQADAIKYQREQAENAARNSVLSTFLGVGGTVAGAMMAGPAGAMVGGAVGSGLGQAAGGLK